MEPALDVIGRTLYGDNGARAFLERTSSIYVLDVTDPQNPKTYGCWNFIHQALNEVERYESVNPAAALETLVPHVRLLASMALRVARRSLKSDRAIVRTCISNASEYNCSASQAQWLYDLNLELREIVIGRIAAIAFDFSYYRHNAASAFADTVVLDTFSAVLAANAVASGPAAVRHFATEWIIPSSRNIPVLALVSVTHHLAVEGMRLTAPAGTRDILQQLSVPICSMVVVPAMAEAVSDNNEDMERNGRNGVHLASSVHANNSRILAKALIALDMWCAATTLTLPQLRHISSKVNLNIVEILNDIMYSDSPNVVGAMADFIDRAMDVPLETELSDDRLNQVKHIINVNDESTFKANFSAQLLRVIESKEMASILDEVSSAVGLQRLRFVELQKQGYLEVCRNLARIGRGVASAWLHVYGKEGDYEPERGLVEFLFKTLTHPSIKIHGITLGVTSQFVSKKSSLAQDLLPILQRRAIIPHHPNEKGVPSLLHTDQHGVTIDEFLLFREHVISDALCVCWKIDSETYLNSCTSAIEEFCSNEAGAHLSFHLEAALFCVEAAGAQLAGRDYQAYTEQISRCVASLSKKTICITSNPLSVARLALFLQKWAVWFQANDKIASAGDLGVTALSYSLVLSNQEYAQVMVRDTLTSPVLQACQALKEIISVEPDHFGSEENLKALTVVWQSLYSERKRGMPISLNTVEPLGNAMCAAILSAPEIVRSAAFESLVSPLLDSIEQLLTVVQMTGDDSNSEKAFEGISDEIKFLASLMRSLSNFPDEPTMEGRMEEDEEENDGHELRGRPKRLDLPAFAFSAIRKGWQNFQVIAAEFHEKTNITSSICELLSESIPCSLDTDDKAIILNDFLTVLISMLKARASKDESSVAYFCRFLEAFVAVHGEKLLEHSVIENTADSMIESNKNESLIQRFQEALLQTIDFATPCLGSIWSGCGEEQSTGRRQGQGEQAFESRAPVVPQVEQGDCRCLEPVLSLLRDMRITCPLYLLKLPATTSNGTYDSLVTKALRAAVGAVSSNDSALLISAMEFLGTMVSPRATDNETVVAELRNSSTISRVEVLGLLMVGCCGEYDHSLLGPTADLLLRLFHHCPSEELVSDVSLAFQIQQQQQQHDFFLLGDAAKDLVLSCFSTFCCKTDKGDSIWSVKDLRIFLEQVWDLHRNTDDTLTLPDSDAVSRFIKRYSVT